MAYSSNRNLLMQGKFSVDEGKSKVAFRIRSGTRTGSNRRAL